MSLLILLVCRVAWDSTGKLQISSPGAEDAGLYGCTVTNDQGSDTETSLLLFAGKII